MTLPMIYLAAPIDQADRIEMAEHRQRAAETLRQVAMVYDPMAAIWGPTDRGLTPDSRPAAVHSRAMTLADGMLAMLPPGVATIGVPMEMAKAVELDIPVLCVGGENSWHLSGEPKIEVWTWDSDRVKVVGRLLRMIEEQQMGFDREPMDGGRENRFEQLRSLAAIQQEIDEWAIRNFGANQPHWHPLMGTVEEVGELCHVYLKMDQGIRSMDEEALLAKGTDAVGDAVVYLMAFCAKQGWDFEAIVRQTWDDVKQRDWVKYPHDGRTR